MLSFGKTERQWGFLVHDKYPVRLIYFSQLVWWFGRGSKMGLNEIDFHDLVGIFSCQREDCL